MKQDEIIEMVRRAGGIDIANNYVGVTVWLGTDRSDFLEAFAKLVAEKEREACAKVCDYYAGPFNAHRIGECADAIRARGRA
jgi:hypothetical protein